MNILVTGAKGFVGKNLVETLKIIRDGKKRDVSISIQNIYEYDKENTREELKQYCSEADFVFHLAGVNRPKNPAEFQEGNFGFANILLKTLKDCGNPCPVMLSSSVQASLSGRFGDSEYGRSKRAGEDLFFSYASETGAKVLVYRFPNLFGKFCRPNYNSAVATFCNAVANDLSYTVNDRNTELELLYIDDLVDEMLAALSGYEHHCEFDGVDVVPADSGRYCYVPTTHHVTLGEIVDLLEEFRQQPETLRMPDQSDGSFSKKLYATYLSYLPAAKTVYPLRMNVDERGSFTELVHTVSTGQVSVNITKPGVTKGLHWHHSKNEQFIVVSGRGLIEERRIDGESVERYEVSGNHIVSVIMKPGFTHSIKNIGDTDLITIMTCNEVFDPAHPDTYYEVVDLQNPEFPLKPEDPTKKVDPVGQ